MIVGLGWNRSARVGGRGGWVDDSWRPPHIIFVGVVSQNRSELELEVVIWDEAGKWSIVRQGSGHVTYTINMNVT